MCGIFFSIIVTPVNLIVISNINKMSCVLYFSDEDFKRWLHFISYLAVKKMSKITLFLTISSVYGQNSKIAKCLFIDDEL